MSLAKNNGFLVLLSEIIVLSGSGFVLLPSMQINAEVELEKISICS